MRKFLRIGNVFTLISFDATRVGATIQRERRSMTNRRMSSANGASTRMAVMYALLDQTRHPVVPTQSEALIAREALPRLEMVAEAGVDIRVRVLDVSSAGPADIVVPLPAVAVRLIVGLLAAMADGKPVSVIPGDAELTSQQAADMLNVSRPHLVKLLNDRQIPYRKVGTHRRVRVADVLAYKQRSLADSRAALDEMAALSQELELD